MFWMFRSAFFRDVRQRRSVIIYLRFGTSYRSHLQGLSSLGNHLPTFETIYQLHLQG